MQKLTGKQVPSILDEIPQTPKCLYIEGALPNPDQFLYLAVVGSRKYSTYGRDVCQKLVSELAGYPIAIISGLAIGIDTIAHEAAIKANLPTVAIPGSGLDRRVLYPSINRHLAERIIHSGGALLSESEPLERATVWSFPKRNRLMAGISKAVLVIEATEKSGTLITARLALDYNRDVLAVPGPIFSPSSVGTNKLIRSGAIPATCAEDILEALNLTINENKVQQNLFSDLSPSEKQVIKIIQAEALPRDEVIRKSGLSASECNSVLMILEIKGVIKESGGEIRVL